MREIAPGEEITVDYGFFDEFPPWWRPDDESDGAQKLKNANGLRTTKRKHADEEEHNDKRASDAKKSKTKDKQNGE